MAQENWILAMLETPQAPSPETGIRACGHLGSMERPVCYGCGQHLREEQWRHGRIMLSANDTPAFLTALGLSRQSVWRSLKRGWFTLAYHHPEPMTQDYSPGGFGELHDPWAFAESQVRHIFGLWGIDRNAPVWESMADMVQEGLLKCWELRHREGVQSWPAFFSTVIRRKVQDLLPHELKYQLWGEADAQREADGDN